MLKLSINCIIFVEKMEEPNENGEEQEISCVICTRSFASKGSLATHKRTHTGEKPYTCKICNKSYFDRSTFDKHKLTHLQIRPFECHVCENRFTDKRVLNRHMKIHTGEKPFACTFCDWKFSYRGDLNSHKKTHLNDKPFSCNKCKKSFATKAILTVHERVHTGEKPYKCDVCDKRFADRSTLHGHKRIHTQEKSFACDTCGTKFSSSSNCQKHKKLCCSQNKITTKNPRESKVKLKEINISNLDIKIEENENYERIDNPLSIDSIALRDNNEHDFDQTINDHEIVDDLAPSEWKNDRVEEKNKQQNEIKLTKGTAKKVDTRTSKYINKTTGEIGKSFLSEIKQDLKSTSNSEIFDDNEMLSVEKEATNAKDNIKSGVDNSDTDNVEIYLENASVEEALAFFSS